MIIGIDPGLDCVGLARFSLARYLDADGDQASRAARAFCASWEVTTSPKEPLVTRLQQIHEGVAAELMMGDNVFVEMPEIEGTYSRGGASRAALNKLYMGIAACQLGALSVVEQVFTPKAGTMPKRERHRLLERVFGDLGIALPRGPRGGKREDQWDAIWIGWWATQFGPPLEQTGRGL